MPGVLKLSCLTPYINPVLCVFVFFVCFNYQYSTATTEYALLLIFLSGAFHLLDQCLLICLISSSETYAEEGMTPANEAEER